MQFLVSEPVFRCDTPAFLFARFELSRYTFDSIAFLRPAPDLDYRYTSIARQKLHRSRASGLSSCAVVCFHRQISGDSANDSSKNDPLSDAVRHRIDSLVKSFSLPASKQARAARRADNPSKNQSKTYGESNSSS